VPLQPCPECQTPVSDSATVCPKRGRPHPTRKRVNKSVQAVASLLVSGLGIVGFMASEWAYQAERSNTLGLVPSAKRYEGWPIAGALVVIGFILFSRAVNRKD
jgi:hypothetical protein